VLLNARLTLDPKIDQSGISASSGKYTQNSEQALKEKSEAKMDMEITKW